MKIQPYILLLIFLSFFACNNVKNVRSNSGVVNVGNNNFVINFPKIDSTYTSKEIDENIQLLQKQFHMINKEVYAKSPLGKNTVLKFEEADTIIVDNPNYSTQVNLMKETREQIFEAQKAWENLIFSKDRRKRFVDEKSRKLLRYKNIADSLIEEANDLRLDNRVILDSIISENITSAKIDSLLNEYLFETGDKLPLQHEFVRKLDPKSYQRMMTLREEDISIRKKGKRPYSIKLENISNDKVFVAIRYFALDDQWVVSGWYSVNPNGSETMNIYANKNEFYYYAKVEGQNKYYGNGPSYYVAKGQAFSIVEKYDTDLYEQELKPFYQQQLNLNIENRVRFSD